MDASSSTKTPPSGSPPPPEKPEEEEERKLSSSLPAGAPESLREATDANPGEEVYKRDPGQEDEESRILAAGKEAQALDFLLGNPEPLSFDVPVLYYIPGGEEVEMTFIVRQVDGKRIVELENKHRVGGVGPFSELDEQAFSAALAAEATQKIVMKASGEELDPRSKEFIGDHVTPEDAMWIRFKYQSGLLAAVAANVRRISGYDNTRVGMAQRPIREAVSNS